MKITLDGKAGTIYKEDIAVPEKVIIIGSGPAAWAAAIYSCPSRP